MEEVWKWINFIDLDGTHYDYTNVYEVSNIGGVRSYVDKQGRLHSQPVWYFNLKPSKQGYVQVGLGHSKQIGLGYNKRKYFKVHKLVIFMFKGQPSQELLDTGEPICINHINELKHDNRVDNLEWCTSKYNTNYGTAIERRSKKLKGRDFTDSWKTKLSKKAKKPVIGVHIETGETIRFDTMKEATRFFGGKPKWENMSGLPKDKIAYGYKWCYEKDFK